MYLLPQGQRLVALTKRVHLPQFMEQRQVVRLPQILFSRMNEAELVIVRAEGEEEVVQRTVLVVMMNSP
jgi:hypothetical protein